MPVTLPDKSPIEIVLRFNEALNHQDLEGMLECLTDDCIFENTSPAPDGQRYVGREAVGAFWEKFFISSVQPNINPEEIFACGDRVIMRWIYRWLDHQGNPGHIRGVDVYQLRMGLICEKLSYVKG